MKFIKRGTLTVMVLILIVAALAYLGANYLKQEQLITQKRLELETKQQEREALQAVLETLRQEVAQLDNAETKEELARQKLNMIMPGEMIYVITYDRRDGDDE